MVLEDAGIAEPAEQLSAFVGSSSTRLRRDRMARPSAIFMRSPWENPRAGGAILTENICAALAGTFHAMFRLNKTAMLPRLQGGRFFGRTLRTCTSGPFNFADVIYPAGGHLPRHAHDRAYMCLIRDGSYYEAYGRRSRECRPLTVAFHPPEEPHEQIFGNEPVASFNVEVGSDGLDRMREFAGPLDQPAEFQGGCIAELAMRLYEEFRVTGGGAAADLESLSYELLAAVGGMKQVCGSRPQWLAAARELLDVRFNQPPTIRELATEAGIHPVYLAAAFRRFQGCSVGDYVRRRRIEYARRKLADGDVPLAELALDAGFADQSHLTRTFKRFTGMTPAQYRTFLRFKTT